MNKNAQDNLSSEKSAETSKKRRRRRPVLRAFALGTLIFVLLGLTFLGVVFHNVVRDGGYAEKWDEDYDGKLLKDEAYGDLPWQMMDVYVPRELAPEKIEGAIMFIHGGAWIGGGRIEQQAFAKRMAKKGYLTGNMEYMLFNDSLKEHKKDYNIQRVLTDVDLALAKLVEIGESYGYKINRVALSGHSAGGHISMLYGYTYETREGGDPPVKIAFVAPRVGPVDFHAKTWNAEKEPKTMAWFASFLSGVKMSPKQYANPDDATEAAIQSISPLYAIKPGVPPTLAAYGAKDALVPERHWQLLRHEFSKIKAKSIADLAVESDMDPVIEGADPSVFDLLVFPNSNHMLGRDPDYTLKWRGLFLAYATRYLDVPAKPDVNLPEKTAPEEEPVLVTNQ